jgi:hypothetical protein
MEPIVIGGQRFILHPDNGWIDSKTRQPANPGLIPLLNSTASQSGSATPNKPKINTSVSQITIGQQKFGWDENNQQWIDVKTKIPADASLQQVLSFASPIPASSRKKLPKVKTPPPPPPPKPKPAPKSRAKAKELGEGEEDAKSFSMPKAGVSDTRTILANMVNSLGTVDFLLKQRFNVGLMSGNTITQNVVVNAGSNMAEQAPQQGSDSNSGLMALGGIAGVAALIATQFKPIKEPLQAVIDVVTNIIGGMGKMFSSIPNFGGKQAVAPAPKTPSTPPPEPAERPSKAPTTPPKDAEPAPVRAPVIPVAPAQSSGSSGSSAQQAAPQPSSGSGATRVSQPTPSTSSPSQRPPQKDAVKPIPLPSNNITALGHWLEDTQGLRVSGHSQFGGQERGRHAANSDHYKDQALDVNFGMGVNESKDAKAGAKFDDLATQLRAAGYGVIWRKEGHEDHMHISANRSVGQSGDNQGPLKGIGSILYDGLGAFMRGIRAIGSTDTTFMPVGASSTDAAQKLAMSAITKTADIIAARTVKAMPQIISAPKAPNVSQGSGTVRTTATYEDKGIVDQYLKYFDVADGPIPTYINS